jgi:replication-associated recombination protein RarA
VNGPEVLSQLRNQLANTIARRDRVPAFDPIGVSPWIAMALLQKAIRRGRADLALRAAATLLLGAPDRLWRRCGAIAFEDIGVADLDGVGLVTASLAGKGVRASLGGEWSVASFVVSQLGGGAQVPGSR